MRKEFLVASDSDPGKLIASEYEAALLQRNRQPLLENRTAHFVRGNYPFARLIIQCDDA